MNGHVDPWDIVSMIVTVVSGAVVLINVAELRRSWEARK